ncbi:MAG: dienelactone hydrolase family protein [Burkholderiaceae bacterium]
MSCLKWTFIVLLLLVAGVGTVAVGNAIGSTRPVGFQMVQVPDGAGGSFPVGVWYPTSASPHPTTLIGLQLMNVAPDGVVSGSRLPLILISHGNGGGPGSHADLAMTLASNGYVVAAPMHAGDNFLDESGLATQAWLARRNRELRLATDYLLDSWTYRGQIDSKRIGAYGFSAGGYSVLVAAGAIPDLGMVAPHCAKQPEFVCAMLRQVKSPLLQADVLVPASQPDKRIRAIVVAAPGLGFTMAGRALDEVTVPVQLWSADDDSNVPYASNAKVVREGLRQRAEFHAVPGARHMSFLVPCGLIGPPALCKDIDGFDRKSFHTQMNASVITFFNRQLGTVTSGG